MIAQNIARSIVLAVVIIPTLVGCIDEPPRTTPATPPPGTELCPGTTGRTYC